MSPVVRGVTAPPGNPKQNYTLVCRVSCKKVPNDLSQCHTKRRIGARGRAHPSFGMTPTVPKKKKSFNFYPFCNFFTRATKNRPFILRGLIPKEKMGVAMCAHPSFGMTPTQDIRDLFT